MLIQKQLNPSQKYFYSENIKIKLFFLAFILCSLIQVYAQNLPKCSYITTENGLGFREVKAVSQDERGLIWIATSQGLERYDGNGFITLSSKSNADIPFPGDNIQSAGSNLIDETTLIILADEKLYKIDLCTNKWERFLLPKEFDGKFVRLIKGSNKKLYIIIEGEKDVFLLQFDGENFKFIYKTKTTKLNGTNVAIDTLGNLWWETSLDGLLNIKHDGTLLKQLKLDSTQWFESKKYNTPVFIDSKGQMFLFPYDKNEIWKFYPNENKLEKTLTKLKSPTSYALEDSNGNLWFSGGRQLIKYNEINGKPQYIDYSDHIKAGLNFSFINHLFEDESKILWISTNNGIIKFPIGDPLIENYLKINGEEWGNEMRGIFQSNDGTIYSYCENGNHGLYKINKSISLPEKININFKKENKFDVLENAKHFVHNPKNDKVYFITEHLYSIDLKTYKTTFEHDFTDITGRLNHNPMTLLNDGSLILGWDLHNVTLYNPITKFNKKLFQEGQIPKDIKTECFVEDKNGFIWIGTNSGIFLVDKTGKLIQRINADSNPSLNVNHVLCILISHNDNIWIGTFGGGINYLKMSSLEGKQKDQLDRWKNSFRIEYLSKKHGLCDENITSILEDNNNTIWASTYNGLSRYYPDTKTFQNYYVSDGLSASEFNYTSSLKDSKGHLWFGGMNGLNKIDPNKDQIDKKVPKMVLLSFSKYNRKNQLQEKYLLNDNLISNPIEISPYDSWFQFNWTLPNYLKNGINSYYVKMEGIDKNWNFNGSIPFIRYHSLPQGKYALYIKGTDNKGTWSPEVLTIPIVIKPFFYQTWWFSLLLISLFIVIVYLIFQYNLNKRFEMERMRTQIASDLHDEVGSMLSGLAMQSELLQMGDGKNEKSKLENISYISRSVIGKMRDLVWSIDSRSDSVESLVERMKEQTSDLFQATEIAYVFETNDLPLKKELSVLVRQQLFLIFSEAINNVVRHAHADHVEIKIGNYNGSFLLLVKDNGKFINKNPHTSGMGMTNMKMRAKKLDATISFNQEYGFEVMLVMKKL